MATTEVIERRVEEADSARSARRSAAAKRIGELAERRAAIAEQLDDIDRQLGDELAPAQDVISVDELARFTDVPAADLTRWLTARKSIRAKRKRPGADGAHGDISRETVGARARTARQASTAPEPAAPGADGADAPARVTAEVA